MHVLQEDELGRLTLYRLRPWDRVVAQCLAWRLDRELACGACPETNVSLAARATTLTSMRFRRDLAASLQRLLMVPDSLPLTSPPCRRRNSRNSRSWPAALSSLNRFPRVASRWCASC